MPSYRLHTDKTWYATLRDLEDTFRKWGVADFDVADPKRTTDRAVTVRFRHPRGREVTLTVGSQARRVDNFRALYLGLEDMRLLELRGISDVVRDAYLQLEGPQGPVQRDPYEVLGVRPDASADVIEAAYRAQAKRLHPDAGGDADAFRALTDAYERIGR